MPAKKSPAKAAPAPKAKKTAAKAPKAAKKAGSKSAAPAPEAKKTAAKAPKAAKKAASKSAAAAKKAPAKKAAGSASSKAPAKRSSKAAPAPKGAASAKASKTEEAIRTAQKNHKPVKSQPLRSSYILFTIQDAREILQKRAKEEKVVAPKKTKSATKRVAPAEPTKVEEAPRQASRHGAASLDDILGLTSFSRTAQEKKVPKKFEKYHRLLLELRDEVANMAQCARALLEVYNETTLADWDTLVELASNEQIMDAAACVAHGFVDEVRGAS